MICLIDLVVMYVLSMVWVFFMVGWMSLFFFFWSLGGEWIGYVDYVFYIFYSFVNIICNSLNFVDFVKI